MHFAALVGNIQIFMEIFDQSIPLHLSAQNGRLEVTKCFLETYDDKNPKSKSGITPLHNAAREGHLQICKLILECCELSEGKKSQGS